jgi:hypothetical protein
MAENHAVRHMHMQRHTLLNSVLSGTSVIIPKVQLVCSRNVSAPITGNWMPIPLPH